MAASMTRASRVGIGTTSPVTSELEFLRCGIAKRRTMIVSDGLRGTRSRFANQVNHGPYTVGGPLVVECRPDTLDLLLPWITGGTKEGNVIALAETLTSRAVTVDKVARVPTYGDCYVNQAVFSGRAGQNVTLELDVQGKTYTLGAAGSFPDIASSLSELAPYVFSQGVLILGGTERPFDDFRLTFNNALMLDRFYNSLTRTDLPTTDRTVSFSCRNPYTADEIDLDDLALAGIAASLTFTNGERSIAVALANLKAPPSDPEIPGRAQEITQTLDFQVYATDSGATITREVVFTNDSTG